MKRILSLSLLCLVLPAAAVALIGQDRKPVPEKKGERSEMEQSMMAMSDHHHDEMGAHMKMTVRRPARSGDDARAEAIARTARQVIEKYRDYRSAIADGFEVFLPNVPQPMYHFTNYRYALEAELRFSPEHPTSLLYEKEGNGYQLIGAMYTAAANLGEAELDRRIPLSVAQWHQHVNLCFPPTDRRAEMLRANTRYGLRGSISTKEECEKAGGSFMPRLFGWMVHVYPFEQTSAKVWSLERQMQDAIEMESAASPKDNVRTRSAGEGSSTATLLGPPTSGTTSAPPASLDDSLKQSSGSLKSEAKEISFELFEPAAPGKHPLIVMLYGSGGMTVGGPLFRLTAQALARDGYVVYLPHYFEKTGTEFATRDDDVKYFAAWLRTIADTIDYAKTKPNVDANRIGLIGFSLGAYLSLSLASVDTQVKAVVEYFGGLPDFFGKQLQAMPPTLILHGDADKTVPVAEAYNLETLLKSRKAPYEIKIYPQQGHGFTGAAAVDALQRTTAFFAKNLKR